MVKSRVASLKVAKRKDEKQMVRSGGSCRFTFELLLPVILSLLAPASHAQRLTNGDDVSVPEPAAGHDYIRLLNETVNPANGSLQVQFNLPVPNGRGITLPASLTYNSNAISIAPFLGGTNWNSTAGPDGAKLLVSDGNWGFSVPFVTATQGQSAQYANTQTYYCNYATYYTFMDATGVQHSLNLDYADVTVPSYPYSCQYSESQGMVNGSSILSGGDAHFLAALTSSSVNSQLVVFGHDGTLYHFPAPTFNLGSTPDYIEDRNGNTIRAPFPTQHGVFTFTDDAGRVAAASSGIGPAGNTTTFSTSGFTYKIGWGSGATGGSNFSVNPKLITNPNNQYTCYPPPATYGANGAQVATLTLPNNEQYTFTYDAATGELMQINYPTGGSISYTWGVDQTQNYEQAAYDGQGRDAGNQLIYTVSGGCVYRYSLPQVKTRTVNYGNGTGLTQTYAYTPAWGTGDWTSKTTTIITTDTQSKKSFKTVYTYSPQQVGTNSDLFLRESSTQVPVESTIQYYDWGSSTLLRTVHKGWQGDLLRCEVDTDGGVNSSGRWYSYLSDFVIDLKEYDYGAISPSACNSTSAPSGFSRETKTPVNIVATPLGGSIWELASRTVLNGAGTSLAETDYSYDLTPIQGITPVTGLPTNTHDETNYPASSTARRGNVTTQTEKCFIGTTPCANNSITTYAYDETGKVVKRKDPCGNATCSDLTGTAHTTSYAYTDSPVGGDQYGNSHAYLTTITDPLGHLRSFSYNYAIGKLISSTDEYVSGSGNPTTYHYDTQASQCSTADALNRLTEIDYPDGGVTTYCYNDSVPSIATNQLLSGSSWKTSVALLDGLGLVIHTQLTSDPSGTDYVDTNYDGLGRVLNVSNPYRTNTDPTYGITSFMYDALGRKIRQTQPDRFFLQWCYNNVNSGSTNCLPNKSTNNGGSSWVDVSDEDTHHWQRSYDGLGRLTGVMEPNSGNQPALETDYTYDTLDNLLSVKQWGGPSGSAGAVARSFTYDSLSRLTQSLNPEAGWTCYGTSGGAMPNGSNCTSGYDANGNLAFKTDARAITASYAFDALNRLLSKKFTGDPGNTPSSCYQYDASTLGVGRLASEWTQSASAGICPATAPSTGLWSRRSILSYDAVGRILGEQQCTPSNCVNKTPYAPAYTFDRAGDVVTATNGVTSTPVVGTLSFTSPFDTAGRLLSVSSNWNDATHPPALFSSGNGSALPCPHSLAKPYSAFGDLMNATYGGSLTLNRGFDVRLHTTCEIDTGSLLKNSTGASATVTVTGIEQSK